MKSEEMLTKLRKKFVYFLTIDSETQDRRCKEFNQAIFDKEGWNVFTNTDLDMVLEKFDRAVKEVK